MRKSCYVLLFALMTGALIVGCTTNGGVSAPSAQTEASKPAPVTSKVFTHGPEKTALAELKSGTNQSVRGYGWKVGLSGDGSEIMVTMPYIPRKNDQTGKVVGSLGVGVLYQDGADKAAATFAEQKSQDLLYGSGGAISDDGHVVVIGAPETLTSDNGYLYCYTVGPDGWTTDKQLYPSSFSVFGGKAGSNWGFSVDLNGDGSTVVVGAPGEDGHGKAHYFLAPDGGWSALDKSGGLTSGDLGLGDPQPGDEFGRSVAISRDGTVIAIGAPGRDNGKGAIYLFVKPKAGWTATENLYPVTLPEGVAGDRFGESVALSADGSAIIVGADGEKDGQGDIHLLHFDKTTKAVDVSGNLTGSNPGEGLGISVDMSADGKTAAAGGYRDKDRTGEVVVLRSAPNGDWKNGKVLRWFEATKPVDPKQVESFFGFSVALSDNGSMLVVGAPGYDGGHGNYFSFKLEK